MNAGQRVVDEVVTVVSVVIRGHGLWAVLNAADANGEAVKLVGTMLGRSAEPGRRLRVWGTWRQDRVHGLQLHVQRAVPEIRPAPVDRRVSAVLRRVPHVGDKRAQLLVDHYGADDVLNAIDASPRQAFLRIAGLPNRHAADATRWWRQQRMHPAARQRGSG